MSHDSIVCRNCGFDNPGVAGFCGRCGQGLRAAAATEPDYTAHCPYCEALNPPEAGFCGACGRQLSAAHHEFTRTAPSPQGDQDSGRGRRLWFILMAVGAVFLLSAGAFFLVPRLLPSPDSSPDTTNQPTKEVDNPQAASADPDLATDKPQATIRNEVADTLAPATSPPTATIAATLTPWPTVTREVFPTVVVAATDVIPTESAMVPLGGDGVMQLTLGSERDYTPDLSPDQRRLVISSEIAGIWQLIEVDVNGSGEPRPLTSGSMNYQAPHFSPDGRTLLVSSDRDGDYDIYQVDSTNGAIIGQLTNLPGDDYFPRWLPDGSGFVFSWRENDIEAIYLYTLSGDQRELVRSTTFEGFAWPSPDGRQVAFYSGRDGDYEIYVMDIDGSNQRRLTVSSGRDASPTWSPDGQWIAFESTRNGAYDLYAMRLDGSDQRRITSDPNNDWFPTFSPDGRWLLFQSDRAGVMDIFRMPFAP